MFTREDGPTALRADLLRGLSFSASVEEVQTENHPERAVAGVASVWNSTQGFVVVLIRFIDPARIERYRYSEPLGDESALAEANAEALAFTRNLGFHMDDPSFVELGEAAQAKRLHNWNLMRKVREPSEQIPDHERPTRVTAPELPDAAIESDLEPQSIEPPVAAPVDVDASIALEPMSLDPSEEQTPEADDSMVLEPITAEPLADGVGPVSDSAEPVPVDAVEDESMELQLRSVELAREADEHADNEPLEFESVSLEPGSVGPTSERHEPVAFESGGATPELPGTESPGTQAPATEPNAFEFVDSEPTAVDAPAAEPSDVEPLATEEAEVLDPTPAEPRVAETVDAEPPRAETAGAESDSVEPIAAAREPESPSAVLGRIELVRRSGKDRRRLNSMGRLLSFF
jgi:hypothetical protein